MKKKLIALMLCVLTLCICFTACVDENAQIKADLTSSKWETEELFSDEEMNTLLDNYYFEAEEIAFADKADFSLAKEYTFRDDGTALLEYNEDKIYDTFYNGLDHFMSTLYANLDKLADIYGELEFDDEQDFKNFIAWYVSDEEWDTAEELLDAFAKENVEIFFSNESSAPKEMTYKINNGVVEVYEGEDMWDELTYNADKGQLVSTVDEETFTKAG